MAKKSFSPFGIQIVGGSTEKAKAVFHVQDVFCVLFCPFSIMGNYDNAYTGLPV